MPDILPVSGQFFAGWFHARTDDLENTVWKIETVK